MNSFKVGVTVSGENTLSYNALRFATFDEATRWGENLLQRWTLAIAYRVVQCDDEVNYRLGPNEELVKLASAWAS